MRTQPKTAIAMFTLYMSGVVTACNLSMLVPVNENYDASWFNVVFASVLAILSVVSLWGRRED